MARGLSQRTGSTGCLTPLDAPRGECAGPHPLVVAPTFPRDLAPTHSSPFLCPELRPVCAPGEEVRSEEARGDRHTRRGRRRAEKLVAGRARRGNEARGWPLLGSARGGEGACSSGRSRPHSRSTRDLLRTARGARVPVGGPLRRGGRVWTCGTPRAPQRQSP